MRLKPFLLLILMAAIMSWVAWGFVLFNVDPFYADTLGFLFFYLSLVCALTGTASLVFIGVYSQVLQLDLPVYRIVSRGLRDGLLVAVLFTALLLLQGLQLLTIWNLGIFVILLLLAVSFYLTLQGQRTI